MAPMWSSCPWVMNMPRRSAVVLHQIADVGDDAVDAVHIVPGKGHAAVHDDDLAAVLIGGHVLADLIETAQRNDFQFFCHKCRLLLCFFTDAAQPPDMEKWPQQNKGGPPRRRPCIAGGGRSIAQPLCGWSRGKVPLFCLYDRRRALCETTKKYAQFFCAFYKVYHTFSCLYTPQLADRFRQGAQQARRRRKLTGFSKSTYCPNGNCML